MQRVRFFFIVMFCSIMFFSCKHAQTKPWQPNSKSKLQVFYFHATIRCPTCNAIEKNTQKLLEESFKSQMDNGLIRFASFNIDKRENRALIEKYQISYTNLLLIRADGTKTDFTYTAFDCAYAEPTKYAELLKAEIEKNLK